MQRGDRPRGRRRPAGDRATTRRRRGNLTAAATVARDAKIVSFGRSAVRPLAWHVFLAGILAVVAGVLAGLIAGCDAPGSGSRPGSPVGSPAVFVGPQWSALRIGGLDVPPDTPVVVRFTVDLVQGTGPCNSFGGRYQFDAGSGRIAFDQLASTARGCVDENRTAIDAAFFQAVGHADRLFLDAGGRLHLTGSAGEIVLAKMVEG